MLRNYGGDCSDNSARLPYRFSLQNEIIDEKQYTILVTAADEKNCDLSVVGHSDPCGLWGRLRGDTADRVSDHAHCSVLIVKN